jgi:hypothetical protein
MNKFGLFIAVIAFLFQIIGYSSKNIAQFIREQNKTDPQNGIIETIINNGIESSEVEVEVENEVETWTMAGEYATEETWQNAYAVFVIEYREKSSWDILEFSLRDFDDNGIPELIIVETNGNGNDGVLTVFSYSGEIYKIGEYLDPKTAAGYRISDNPLFSGLFTLWRGGGIEHYGYLSVIDGKLVYEDVWCDDHSKENRTIEEISSDKLLIKESMDAHPPYEYTENILKMHFLNDDANFETINLIIITYGQEVLI